MLSLKTGRIYCQQNGLTIRKPLTVYHLLDTQVPQDIQSTSITNNIYRNKQEPMEDKHDAGPQGRSS